VANDLSHQLVAGNRMIRHQGSPSQLVIRGDDGRPVAECDRPLSERELIGVALALGAANVHGWSLAEERLAKRAKPVPSVAVNTFRELILSGSDPLGEALCRSRSPAVRRETGATFTPNSIVEAMIEWAVQFAAPGRVVDPGCGSGRFLVAAAKRLPRAHLIGVEIDPLSGMLARANLASLGLAGKASVILADYRNCDLPRIRGKTLFIGNPPYVRHHRLGEDWKRWLTNEAAKRGLVASQLSGLHVHFFLATAAKAAPGDFGAFITAAEWLDVNYGSIVRELFLDGLGGARIDVIDPTVLPFPDAATTAAIAYFNIGTKPAAIDFKQIDILDDGRLTGKRYVVPRERLAAERRWSRLARPARKHPTDHVELGELCRVHRGQVTGSNKVWIEGPHSAGLPESVFYRSITKARELFAAGPILSDGSMLRRVIDLPIDLDDLAPQDKRIVERFLANAKAAGAHLSYVAANRRAWWSVGLREPAPILATYMARRPPAFVRNLAGARHINIAHGIYPRQAMSEGALAALVVHLSNSVCVSEGRTYAGGLTKFEPREMERLLMPRPEILDAGLPE